jgi:hypothetical protein
VDRLSHCRLPAGRRNAIAVSRPLGDALRWTLVVAAPKATSLLPLKPPADYRQQPLAGRRQIDAEAQKGPERTAELEAPREEACTQAKASFLATMSHADPGTPLKMALGMSTLLAETCLDPEQTTCKKKPFACPATSCWASSPIGPGLFQDGSPASWTRSPGATEPAGHDR